MTKETHPALPGMEPDTPPEGTPIDLDEFSRHIADHAPHDPYKSQKIRELHGTDVEYEPPKRTAPVSGPEDEDNRFWPSDEESQVGRPAIEEIKDNQDALDPTDPRAVIRAADRRFRENQAGQSGSNSTQEQ